LVSGTTPRRCVEHHSFVEKHFATNTGTGFTVQLDALPIDGRIVLTEPKADETE
jgi:hypothetical protein